MIQRSKLRSALGAALGRSRIVAVIGPRQCGKTTLARELVDVDSANYFDLEDPLSLVRLEEPMTALRPLEGLIVIDEVQRRPDLFPVLRVLADRRPLPAKFLILGSAAPELLRQSSESLAGRIEFLSMGGLTLRRWGRHHFRGIGCEEVFLSPFWPRPNPTASSGGGISSRLFWSAICRNGAFPFPR